MNDFKRDQGYPMLLLLAMATVLGLAARWSHADTGTEGAVRTECGQFVFANQITMSSNVATALIGTVDNHTSKVIVRNMSSVYKVYVGSTTNVTTSTGFELAVATTTAGDNRLELGNFTGQLFAIAQAGGQSLDKVGVFQCRSNN